MWPLSESGLLSFKVNIQASSSFSTKGASRSRFLLCLRSHLSKSAKFKVAKGSAIISLKESCLWLIVVLNGCNSRRSVKTFPSSVDDDLWLCDVEWWSRFTWQSKFSTVCFSPPPDLLERSIALSVLFGTIALIAFLTSLLRFSCSKSIFYVLSRPPFEFASDKKTSFCTTLINISIPYVLKLGNDLK